MKIGKVGYVLLAGACVIGGEIYRESVDADLGDRGRTDHVRRVDSDWQERQAGNAAYIGSLAKDDLVDDVVQSLGDADFSQTYDNGVEVLMYRTRNERNDWLTTEDETAVLVFQNRRLIGFKDSKDWFDGNRVRAQAGSYQSEQADNKIKIGGLLVGDNRSAIIEQLGRPDFIDYPAEQLEILSYRTRSESLDGYTTRDETTRLLLEDGVLIAIGT